MTAPSLRRRFLVMLWLSLALHALALGFIVLPPPVTVPLPKDISVEIVGPAPSPRPEPRPVSANRGVAAPPASVPQPLSVPLPPPSAPAVTEAAEPAPAAAAAPQVAAEPSREAPGLPLDLPLLADPRYYTARELDVQPIALRRLEPAYPPAAEARGVGGRVLVRLHLEADGSVSRIEVVSVAPAGVFGELFRQATLEALRSARFRPAQRNGQPVRAVVEIPVVFTPDG